MKKQKTSILILLMFILTNCAHTVSISETFPKEINNIEAEGLSKCDKALRLCDRSLKQKQEIIDNLELTVNKQNENIKELQSSETNKPFWFILGAVLTGLLVFLVK